MFQVVPRNNNAATATVVGTADPKVFSIRLFDSTGARLDTPFYVTVVGY